jgi:hypothetical protein
MRFIAIILLLFSVIPGFVSWSARADSPVKANHLFFIERSKNKNLVQYDIRLTENSDLPDSSPVNAYWILENGRREELNSMERKYAYGISRQEKIEKDKLKVVLVALKGREILVEKIKGFFKAVVSINGKESILHKIYIKSEETAAGLPRVLYVELIGRATQTNLPLIERIIPGRSLPVMKRSSSNSLPEKDEPKFQATLRRTDFL